MQDNEGDIDHNSRDDRLQNADGDGLLTHRFELRDAELVADGERDEAERRLRDDAEALHLLQRIEADVRNVQRAETERTDEQTADEVRRDRRQMYELCQAGHQQTDDQSDAQTNQGFFHFLNTYLSSRYACGHTGKCRSPPLHLSIVFPVIGKKQNSKKFYNKFMNMSIFLGTMFPRKTFFPVVLLNMVSREVKPVEGIKFCSSFLRGQLKASVNEKSPLTEGAYSF